MRFLPAAVLSSVALLGCSPLFEPDYRDYGARPHEWTLPGPDTDVKVFGPISSDEVHDFVAARQSEGWSVVGYDLASLPEDVMIDTIELDQPAPAKRKGPWTFDIPKTMDSGLTAPAKQTVPPYLAEGVKTHRQKYLLTMRRWQ